MTRFNYLLIGSLCSLALSGCSVMQPDEQLPLQPANRVVTEPVVIQPPDLKMQYQLTYGNNPALQRAYQKYLKTGNAPNIVTDGFEQFAYGTGSQPVIAASPFELTVISLEPGESVTNVSSGDPTRWSYSLAYSGQGSNRQAHIMVKPSQPGISTDLVITTDKRFYTLKIMAVDDGKYVRDVRFWYPEEMQDFWNKYNAEQSQALTQNSTVSDLPNLNVNNLNFNYSIATNGIFALSPPWKPTRVFDDGTHTYIQFPKTVTSGDLPALFVVTGNDQELVNYRTKPPYFVVDKLFKQAVLVTGVGNNQIKVIITNHSYS